MAIKASSYGYQMALQTLKNQTVWTPEHVVDSSIEKKIVYSSQLGALYNDDIIKVIPYVHSESIDTIFADPPFNLSKVYGNNVNDNLTEKEYLSWCKTWLDPILFT